ncbi:peptidoglycan DD-metalloendopeptidase family protein [Bacillota bacterium Lsc_1132]
MGDYIKRFLIAGVMALCVSLLFLGGRHSQASMLNSNPEKNQWIWPADGIISDTYGTRHGKHKGLDIAGGLNSPIVAVEAGLVEKSYYSDTYGNVVFIKHPNGYVTVYAHLNSRLVTEGQAVKKGEIIGKMGQTGQATGVHLHFETHQKEWTFEKKYALDPEKLLGTAKMGEVVQAGAIQDGESVLEASSRLHGQEGSQKVSVQVQNQNQSQNVQPSDYLVKSGDTLWSIAEKFHMAIEEVQQLNKLTGTNIIAGQKITVKHSKENQYTVKQGDTLSSISVQYHLSIEKIKEYNQLSSDRILPEQILTLPK